MTFQLATHRDCRNPDTTKQTLHLPGCHRAVVVSTDRLSSLRSCAQAVSTMRPPAVGRIQPPASAAANDGPFQSSIEEAVNRWIDQNPPQLYRGGA